MFASCLLMLITVSTLCIPIIERSTLGQVFFEEVRFVVNSLINQCKTNTTSFPAGGADSLHPEPKVVVVVMIGSCARPIFVGAPLLPFTDFFPA